MRISNQAGDKMRMTILLFPLVLATVFVMAIFLASCMDPPNSAASHPVIVSRQEWKAKEPLGAVKEHTIRYITIHHTASPQKDGAPVEQKMQSLQYFAQSENRLASGKMKPAWSDVPYHYYIAVDGKIAEGRDIKFVGDTNTDYDPTGHALVVLEGNFETEQPSSEQQKSLQVLVAWLSTRYKVAASEIKAHNDYASYASTACPGEKLKRLLPALRQRVSEVTKVSEKSCEKGFVVNDDTPNKSDVEK
jgi:hypothetical protein